MKIGIETETIELKTSTSELKEACVSICAMLNKHGVACVYFGVNNNGEIIGQEYGKDTLRKISRKINELIVPTVIPTIDDFEFYGAYIISVKVVGTNPPYSIKDQYYIRSSDEDKKINKDELLKLYSEDTYTNTWEKKVTDYTISDIDNKTLDKFYKDVEAHKRLPHSDHILEKFNLVSGNNLTNAGYTLFGAGYDAKELAGPVHLKMGIFANDDKIKILDMQNYEDNILNLIDIAQKYIFQNIKWEAKIDGMQRIDIPEIPAEAIREAIVNNFAHARYDNIQQHVISIFPNRIIISNPGKFTENHRPYDYINGTFDSVIRNKIIARCLYVSGNIEQFGTGLKKIAVLCDKANIKYSFSENQNDFSITFYRSSYYEKLTESEQEIIDLLLQDNNLTRNQLACKTNKSIRSIQRIINSLKEKKLIARQGSNKKGSWLIL